MAAVTLAVRTPGWVFTGVWSKLVVQLACVDCGREHVFVRLRVVVLVEGLCDKPSAY